MSSTVRQTGKDDAETGSFSSTARRCVQRGGGHRLLPPVAGFYGVGCVCVDLTVLSGSPRNTCDSRTPIWPCFCNSGLGKEEKQSNDTKASSDSTDELQAVRYTSSMRSGSVRRSFFFLFSLPLSPHTSQGHLSEDSRESLAAAKMIERVNLTGAASASMSSLNVHGKVTRGPSQRPGGAAAAARQGSPLTLGVDTDGEVRSTAATK